MSSRNGARRAVALVLGVLVSGSCAREEPQANGEVADAAAEAVLISPENIAVVTLQPIQSGPTVGGSLTPERSSTIRAEVGGSVLQVMAEAGQSVRRGQLLARIEDVTLREQVISARSAVRSAEQAEQIARRNVERSTRLSEAGAISDRDLEAARIALSSASAQLADAAARLSLAEKQLANAQVQSPINGVVAERPVNAGDVVTPGDALFTIVDPRSMQMVAAVPAARIAAVQPGAEVHFRVQGYPGRIFSGRVTRVHPAADPATRQVPITVSIPNAGGALVSGLYAEGIIGTESRTALTAPVTAVDLTGGTPIVLRLKAGQVERVDVQTGIHDEQNERIELSAGVAAGDTVLLGAAQGITPGTMVRVQAVETPARR